LFMVEMVSWEFYIFILFGLG
jgi:hypothetical protein